MAFTEHRSHPFGAVGAQAHCSEQRRRTLEHVIQLAVEIAREGREGRKIGTLFVVGDVDEVERRSRPLMLDPLQGHDRDVLAVTRPDFRETVKELAQLDGAFLVDDDGTIFSAARFIEVDLDATQPLAGLGTRHAAAASISRTTSATAVVVSQSSMVRVFIDGEVRAEIVPELFLLSKEQLFTPHARVSQVPDAGVTLAVTSEG